MSDLYLISSATNSHQNNTRTSFETIIPRWKELHYSGLCLKELYFQANFITIDKQESPHIVFLTKAESHLPMIQRRSTNQESDLLLSHSVIKQDIQYNVGKKETKTVFEFGVCTKKKFPGVVLIEVVFNPVRIEKSVDIINLLNFILEFTHIDTDVKFYEGKIRNSVGYKSGKCSVLFDQKFLKFLGLSETNMINFKKTDVSIIKPFLIRQDISGLALTNYWYYNSGLEVVNHNFVNKPYHHEGIRGLDLLVNAPSRVLVISDCVSPQIYKSRLVRYLGVLNLISSSERLQSYQNFNGSVQLVHYQPVHPLFLEVKSDLTQSIKITLEEENATVLKLDVGGPTLVSLKTTQDSVMNCHSIVFSSSDDENSKKIFPSNQAGRFHHQLPKDLEVKENNLRVEVVSLSISEKIYNINRPHNAITITYTNTPKILLESKTTEDNTEPFFNKTTENFFDPSAPNFKTESVQIKPGHYQTLEDVITVNREAFQMSLVDITQENDRIKFTNLSKEYIVNISMHYTLSNLLGLSSNIKLNRHSFNIADTFTASHKARMNLLAPDYILVYADFIEHSVVGGITAPILKIVPPPSPHRSSSGRIYYDFQGQNSVKVCKDVISSFCIELRDVSGQILEFDSSEHTDILLSFKQYI